MRLFGNIFACAFLGLTFFGCGVSEETAVLESAPKTEEGTNGNSGDGKVKMTTITGAQAPASSNDEAKEVDLSGISSNATEIEWLDFETAIDRNKEDKKFIFIDVYTTWCSWCKKMDQSTFKNPNVVKYMDENFYCVKMDAESKESIAYRETLYGPKQHGSKMYNELAINLMSGKMSFPSFVVLNKREVKRGLIAGYQTDRQLILALDRYLNK